MAKRPEIAGQGMILLESRQLSATYRTSEHLEADGGQILHRYGTRVLICDIPSRGRGVTSLPNVRGYHAGPVEPPGRLSDVEAMGLAAWNLRQSARYATAKARRPHEGVRWDAAGPAAPDPPDGPGMAHVSEAGPAHAMAFGAEDTSLYLIGSVAVGLVIVEGPTPDLQFTQLERTKVVAEVQEGLTWLGRKEPKASVTFAYDIQIVRITAPPDPTLSGYEALESRWRDPAMAKLGYSANFLGVTNYVNAIRRNHGTRWAYVGLFTKYPVQHFAYASKPRLVMQYSNDGWGPDNIDRVFTHESGHIFGCPDEYRASNCTCDARFGYLREPNGNCEACSPSVVPCLMSGNVYEMCRYTPAHLGWRDSDNDGSLDPVDPVGHPAPGVDLGRICTILPFICQLFGLSPGRAPAGVVGAVSAAGPVPQPPAESVPIHLLRRVLTDEEMKRVEAAIAAEELQYLEALERKLRAAADEIRRTSGGSR